MECNEPECSTVQTDCGCEDKTSSGCGGCECPSCSGKNPLDFVVMMWHKAAMAAMLELKKERIKSRLESSFGETLDKGADAMVEAIQKKIQSAVQGSSTEQELRSKLASILNEATNK